MTILKSILDTDQYKFTMMAAVLELFPDTKVTYTFTNRGQERFDQNFLEQLNKEIQNMADLSLLNDEYTYLQQFSFFKPSFLAYLKNYRFNPSQIITSLTSDNNLSLTISGLWRDTILWEVPLLAIISELYFKTIATKWRNNDRATILLTQQHNFLLKIEKLAQNNCIFADFGTRRRRALWIHDSLIDAFIKYRDMVMPAQPSLRSSFIGTSNMYFAKKYDLKPIGSVAHEFIMGCSVLEGIRHANYYAMQNWVKVFNADLGTALTDTYGTDAFLRNFNRRLSMLYQGVRHDSGCPYTFVDKIVKHYQKFNIEPMSKFIIFSDSLNVKKCIRIREYCNNKINCSFGIGTNITNDFAESSALNIVIKLSSVNGTPVVKLSDSPGKEMGNAEALKVTKWIIDN